MTEQFQGETRPVKTPAGLTAILLVFTILSIIGCAKIEPPPGGPPDETAPEVITTTPQAGALNVARETDIEVTFSEKIKADEIAQNVFISPMPAVAPRIKVDGDKIKIRFADSLKMDQTYLVALKTDIEDLRRNRMENPFKFAFTTGRMLDSGSIAGQVYENFNSADRVDIWLFEADTGFSIFDTLPDYIGQTGSDGSFRMDYLGLGEYYAFAVKDVGSDREYVPANDPIGIPANLIRLDSLDPILSGVRFNLISADTIRPELGSVEYNRDLLIDVRFSEAVNCADLSTQNFTLINADSQAVELEKIYSARQISTKLLLKPVSSLDSGRYHLSIKEVRDQNDNPLAEDKDTASFVVTNRTDSLPPTVLSTFPADRQPDFPLDSMILLKFSEPVVIDSADTVLTVMIPDSSLLPIREIDAPNLSIRAKLPFEEPDSGDYLLYIDLTRIHDLSGNPAGDSILTVGFALLDKSDWGAVSGKVILPGRNQYANPLIRLRALQGMLEMDLDLDDSLRFYLDLPAGRYIFYAFDDLDSNGSYDPGRILPIEYSEPYYLFADTISVRNRFETEDILLELE